ncbi:MAG: MFS transporter [Gammaproteobacteria bacterium]
MFNQQYLSMAALFLVILLDGMGVSLLFPILNTIIFEPQHSILPLTTNMASREIYYSIVLGIFTGCWFFGTAIVSDLSDSIGRKKALMICVLGSAIGYILSALAIIYHSIWLLIVSRIIDGFTVGNQPIAQAAIIDISTPDTKARNIGFILLSASIGFVFGPIAGGVLADDHLVRWFRPDVPLYLAALLSLLSIILLFWFYRDNRPPHKPLQLSLRHSVNIFIAAFTTPGVNLLTIPFLFCVLGWSSFFNYIAVYLYQIFQFTTLHTGLYLAVVGVGFGIGSGYLCGRLAKHFNLRHIVIYTALITALGILITSLAPAMLWIWLVAPIVGAAGITCFSTLINLFSDQVDADSQGWVMGVTSAVAAFSFTITGLTEGYLLHINAHIPLLIATVLLILCSFTMTLKYYRKS